jgi:UDP-2-acetamido-2,6-beta-L-arabino-hexul-4-ose reductase
MKTILVTGADGFMGRNLCVALRRDPGCEVLSFDLDNAPGELPALASRADLVFHLAGVNRPKAETEFVTGNADLTRELCEALVAAGRHTPVVLSSSIQADLDNPYGRSKRAAEDFVLDYQRRAGAAVYIYRFPNVFGKWSRPNYNTVVATFCHNIARGLPVQVSNRAAPLRFVYIDDIVRDFLAIATRSEHPMGVARPDVQPVHHITLGELHDLIVSFRENRRKSLLPDLANPLVKNLYSTYLAFLDPADLAYPVELKPDNRGWLFELVKSRSAGQIFVSRTRPGITRGNHYHDTKVEKFCVIQGEGIIRFRHVLGKAETEEGRGQRAEWGAKNEDGSDNAKASSVAPAPLCPLPSPLSPEIIEYAVNDRNIQVVDIPPGYTHSIENTGPTDMLTLFWACEIFDPQRPDTYAAAVVEGRVKKEE